MPVEDKFVLGGLAALTLGCTASLLWLSSSVYASSKSYCDDGTLALWLVCLCSLLCAATILVACFVVWKSFRLAFCFILIKFLALAGIVVVLALVYMTYLDSSGDTPYNKWVHRVGEDWASCMSKSNLCQNGNIEKLLDCCEKPWGCEGGNGTEPLDCSLWISPQQGDGMCYNCEACKITVFQKLVAKWKTLKSWWMIALTLSGLTTIILELVYHVLYRLKELREQQQEAVQQQHEQQLIELRNLDRERNRSVDRGPYES